MLKGTGAFWTIQQQLQYNLTVYALVAAAAIGAWKALPLTDEGDHLSKILQGPSNPFSDFCRSTHTSSGAIFWKITKHHAHGKAAGL